MWSFREILEIRGEQPLCMANLAATKDMSFGNSFIVSGLNGLVLGFAVGTSTRR
jgi:hypothetical protein